MNTDDILDYGLEDKVSTLTDFQLIGIVSEKVIYPNSIIAQVKAEIEKRKISPDEISNLKTKYQIFQILDNQKSEFKYTFHLGFILILIASTQLFSAALANLVIVLCSIVAVKQKFEKGIEAEKRIWKVVKLFCLISFLITILYAYANPN